MNNRIETKEEKEYREKESEALDIMRKALEKALECFNQEQRDKGCLALAQYCFGYLGVRFDLTV